MKIRSLVGHVAMAVAFVALAMLISLAGCGVWAAMQVGQLGIVLRLMCQMGTVAALTYLIFLFAWKAPHPRELIYLILGRQGKV